MHLDSLDVHSHAHACILTHGKYEDVVFVGSKELEDHLAAHKIHDQWLDKDMKTSNSAVDITVGKPSPGIAGNPSMSNSAYPEN